MISVGIFNGYYPYTLEETIKRVKKDGFNCIQLDLSFKDFDLNDPQTLSQNLTLEKARTIRNAFRDANIGIVISETGTYEPCSDWVFHEKNATEEAFQEIKAVIRDLAIYAHEHNAVFLVENYVNN